MRRPRPALMICAATLLGAAACDDASAPGSARSPATAAAERPAATRLAQRDVEAPDVFQKSEAGLWDGRPSLGGVWVAHPDVSDPERVMIRNETTGATVVGALFRRERDNPGPRFQVSSDAAASLGLIAGAPTKLSVTALRRAEDPAPEATDAGPDTATTRAGEETVAGSEADTEAVVPERAGLLAFLRRGGKDTAESAGTLVSDAPGGMEEPVSPAPPASAAPVAASAAQELGEEAEQVEETPAETSGRGFLFGLFSRPPAADDVMPEPAALTDATPEATAAAARPTPEPLGRSLVQIGIFSVEANANRTADMMRENGLTPTIYEHASADESYWRVVVGPARTEADRDRLQARARGLGFTDAFPVAR